MALYEPATSFHPCPWRASDIFKSQPASPPTYYLKDHTRIVYTKDDWPTTFEDEGMSEEQEQPVFKPTFITGSAHTKPATVSARPLSLLSVKMREYRGKGEPGSDGSDHEYILKQGQFASPTEGPTPAVKEMFPQFELPFLKSNKVATHSRVDSGTSRTVLGAANANAMKKPATEPSSRTQVVLKQTKGEKENLALVSSESGPFHVAGGQPAFGEDAREKQSFLYLDLPDPFLGSDEESDDHTE